MDEKDFYPFKKSVEKQRDIEFDESHWEALNQRLDIADGPQKRRPTLGWWMLAASVIGALLLGNLLLLGTIQKTTRSNAELQQELKQFTEKLTSDQTDTVLVEKKVYIYDTIFKEKIVIQTNRSVSEERGQLMTVLSIDELKTLAAGKLPERLQSFPKEAVSGLEIAEANESNTSFEKRQETLPPTAFLETANISSVQLLPKRPYNFADYPQEVEWEPLKAPLMQRVRKALIPNNMAAGLIGGPLFLNSEARDETKGASAGMAAEIIFSDHLRLRGDVSYARTAYTSEQMNPELGVPVIPPPSEDYTFEKVSLEQNSILLNIGIKYLMNTHSKWQPFLYVGYGVSAVLPYKLDYNFEHNILDTEIQIEKESEATYFNKGAGMASLGLSYTPGDNLSFQLDGFYRSQLFTSSFSNPDLAGLRASVLYEF